MRSLSHIAMFHILRVLSGKQSSGFCRVARRTVSLGMNLYPLFFSLANLLSAHQRLYLCFQPFHRLCRFEYLHLGFLCRTSYGHLSHAHGSAGILKHLIFCKKFLSKSLYICIHNPEARFPQIPISVYNSFPVDCLCLLLA